MLKLRFFDDEKVVAQHKGEKIDDFDCIMDDLKKKYSTKKENN